MIGKCIPTKYLCLKTYQDLIKIFVSQGFINIEAHTDFEEIQNWNYLGIDCRGSIVAYDHPWSYMSTNEWMDYQTTPDAAYPNILSEEEFKALLVYYYC